MIVGLTGYKGSGKDTVADHLVEYGFVRWSFADKLREVCSDVFNIPMNYFTDRDLKEKKIEKFNMSPREILIHIGTNGFRHVSDSVWCDYVIDGIKEEPEKSHVITDIRFPNEYHAVKNIGGHVFRTERDGCELGNDIPTSGLYNCGCDDIITIDNNFTIDDLHVRTNYQILKARSMHEVRK